MPSGPPVPAPLRPEVRALLADLAQADVELAVDGDDLTFRSPPGAVTPARRRTIVEHKAALVAYLRGEAGLDPDDLPLTPGQRSLWFLAQVQPDSAAYTIPCAAVLEGPLDPDALVAAFRRTVGRHEALRARFGATAGRPRQWLADGVGADLHVVDLSDLEPDAYEAARTREVEGLVASTFDLEAGPLVRARLLRRRPDLHVLLLAVHHIVFDERSLAVFVEGLAQEYARPTEGEATSGEDRPWRSTLAAASGGRARASTDLAYWERQLSGVPVPPLPGGWRAPRPARGRADPVVSQVDPSTCRALDHCARRSGTTRFTVLVAVLAAALARHTGERDICVGTPVSTRGPGAEGVVGMHVNVVVLRIDAEPALTLRRVVHGAREVVIGAIDHAQAPFDQVVARTRPHRDEAGSSLFSVLFVTPRAVTLPSSMASITWTPLPLPPSEPKYPISASAAPTAAGGLELVVEHDPRLVDADDVAALVRSWVALLEQLDAHGDVPIAALPLLPPDERRHLLGLCTAPARGPDRRCVPDLVRDVARTVPDSVAVRSGDDHLTYQALVERSESVAAQLRGAGVAVDDRVAVAVERDIALVPLLLGVWSTGASCVPIDPDAPSARVREVLGTVRPRVVVRSAGAGSVDGAAAGVEELDPHALLAAPPSPPARRWPIPPSAAAVHLFTSGSTGRPKAVVLEHRNLVSFLEAVGAVPWRHEGEHVAATTGLAFDVSLFELLGTLVTGGTVHLLASLAAAAVDPARHHVGVVGGVPSAMANLLDLDGLPSHVGLVNLAGEPVPPALVDALRNRASGATVTNLYGPSEASVLATGGPVPVGGPPTIGRRLANTSAYVVSTALEPQPWGVVGEIALGGAGVARGYHDDPAQTALRFVPDPYTPVPGGRLYRTGDRASIDRTGTLSFAGRTDDQVKLRGARVELAEVEAHLRADPDVEEAAVVVVGEDVRRKVLVGFIVGAGTLDAVRRRLASSLPSYMVPSRLVALDALPANPNGKVDRPRLVALGGEALDGPSARGPASPSEHVVVEVWATVLGRAVPVDETFFELGGNSMLIVLAQHLLERAIGREVPVAALFQHPTVAALAAWIDEGGGPGEQSAAMATADARGWSRVERRRRQDAGRAARAAARRAR